MNRIAPILVAVLLVAGCGWFSRRDRVIKPDEEFPHSYPDPTEATSAPASQPVEPAIRATAKQGLTVPPSSTTPASQPARPATRPSAEYRVVGRPEVVAAAMLQVNDKFITLDEVLRPIRDRLAEAAAGAGERTFRLKALDLIRDQIHRQVEQTLLLAEAEGGLTEDERRLVDEQLANRLRQAVAEMGGSRAKLDQHLRSEGADIATWREDLRQALVVQAYMQRRLGKRIVVNRRMMWDYYVGHRQEFRKPDRVQMQIISVPHKAFLPKDRKPTREDLRDARLAAKILVREASAALARGDDFAKVAKAHSRGPMASAGGVWGMMERGSFRAEAVEETAFAQQVGRVSKVIETPAGFYIVKTLAVQRGKEVSFEQVQEKIVEELRRQQFQRLTRRYRAELYGKAVIIEADRFERLAVDAAVRRHYKRS